MSPLLFAATVRRRCTRFTAYQRAQPFPLSRGREVRHDLDRAGPRPADASRRRAPRRRGIVFWIVRYLPAEIVGTAAMVARRTRRHHLDRQPRRHRARGPRRRDHRLLRRPRRSRSMPSRCRSSPTRPRRRIGRTGLLLVAEFGVAELLDTLLIRPAALMLGVLAAARPGVGAPGRQGRRRHRVLRDRRRRVHRHRQGRAARRPPQRGECGMIETTPAATALGAVAARAPSRRDRRTARDRCRPRGASRSTARRVLLLDTERVRRQYRRLRNALPFVRFHYAVKALVARRGHRGARRRRLRLRRRHRRRTRPADASRRRRRGASSTPTPSRRPREIAEAHRRRRAHLRRRQRRRAREVRRRTRRRRGSWCGSATAARTRRAICRASSAWGRSKRRISSSGLGNAASGSRDSASTSAASSTIRARFADATSRDARAHGGARGAVRRAVRHPRHRRRLPRRRTTRRWLRSRRSPPRCGPCSSRMPRRLDIIAEPGRILVAEAMTLVTSVVGIAERATAAGTTSTTACTARTRTSLTEDVHPLVFAERELRGRDTGSDAPPLGDARRPDVRLVGRRSRARCCFPELAVGDLLVSPVMGAYTTVTATRFNGRPLTPIARRRSRACRPARSPIESSGASRSRPAAVPAEAERQTVP